MSKPLEAKNVVKVYRYKGKETPAINGFTFNVERNMVFSLLGRNGSGKTTFVKIATTQLDPDSGSVKIFGKDIIDDADDIRQMTSLVPQESRPFPHLTPWEHVYYFQRLLGNTREAAKDRAEFVINLLDMKSFYKTECVNLSGGQKQLTMVAMALSDDAQIYFLDEPTIGLDIITRKKVWEAIEKYKNMNKTVLLTTHYLDEAAYLSDEIAIVSYGKLVSQGTLDQLRSRLKYDTRIMFRGENSQEKFEKYGRIVEDKKGVLLYTDHSNVERIFSENNFTKERLEIGPVGLDDVFISLVGENIEDDD